MVIKKLNEIYFVLSIYDNKIFVFCFILRALKTKNNSLEN